MWDEIKMEDEKLRGCEVGKKRAKKFDPSFSLTFVWVLFVIVIPARNNNKFCFR
jgi:hypothetical protein